MIWEFRSSLTDKHRLSVDKLQLYREPFLRSDADIAAVQELEHGARGNHRQSLLLFLVCFDDELFLGLESTFGNSMSPEKQAQLLPVFDMVRIASFLCYPFAASWL